MNLNGENFISSKNIDQNTSVKILFPKTESKYIIKIYISKKNTSITFKVENIETSCYYFSEKFVPIDLRKKFKGIISQGNIDIIFDDIKNIINNCKLNIDEDKNKLNLIFLKDNNNNSKFIFELSKKFICQNRINRVIIEKINYNIQKLKIVQKEFDDFNQALNTHQKIFNNIYDKIDKINNKIKKIHNDINNINKVLNEKEKNKNTINNNSKEKKDKNIKGKKNVICFLFNIYSIFILLIISTILSCYLFFYCKAIEEEMDIQIKGNNDFYRILPHLENLFGFSKEYFEKIKKESRKELKKNNYIIKFNNNNIKIELKYNEINNEIQKLNIEKIFLDQNQMFKENPDTLNYLKNQIMIIKGYNTSNEFFLNLKYSKENSEYDFYINCKEIKENLISIQKLNGDTIYLLFSSNIINLMLNISKKTINQKNYNKIYILKQKENDEEENTNEELFMDYIKYIYDFVNRYNSDFKGQIVNVKIYEIISKKD